MDRMLSELLIADRDGLALFQDVPTSGEAGSTGIDTQCCVADFHDG